LRLLSTPNKVKKTTNIAEKPTHHQPSTSGKTNNIQQEHGKKQQPLTTQKVLSMKEFF
jgi:hypothetical protein